MQTQIEFIQHISFKQVQPETHVSDLGLSWASCIKDPFLIICRNRDLIY